MTPESQTTRTLSGISGTRVFSLLYQAVQHTSDTVFVTDRDGRIEFVNAAFESTTGFTRDEALGRKPNLLRSGHQPPAYYQKLWSTILAGNVFRDVVINRKKDGELWYADQTITPMRDVDGNVTHFVSILKDMTEQRKRQEQEIEMQLAARVQRRLYPAAPPLIPGWDIHGAAFPAAECCGDYYDYVPMTGGRCGLVIGDVSGHGFGPALVMAETRALLRAYCQTAADPGQILTSVNRDLEADLEGESFVTLLFAAIDPVTHRLYYVNAGHPAGWVLDGAGGVKATLQSVGLPLGIEPDSRYVTRGAVDLVPGDVVVLTTDGLTDEGPDEETRFEDPLVLDVLRKLHGEPAADIVRGLYEASRAFSRGRPQEDDTTIVVCKVGKPA